MGRLDGEQLVQERHRPRRPRTGRSACSSTGARPATSTPPSTRCSDGRPPTGTGTGAQPGHAHRRHRRHRPAGDVPRQPGLHPPRPPGAGPALAGPALDHVRAALQGLAGADVGAPPLDPAVLLGRGRRPRRRAPALRAVPPPRLRGLAGRLGGGHRRAPRGRRHGPPPPRRPARRARPAAPHPAVAGPPDRHVRRPRRPAERLAGLVAGDRVVPWSPTADGYGPSAPRPTRGDATVLTPSVTVDVLAAGYAPVLHPSASLRTYARESGSNGRMPAPIAAVSPAKPAVVVDGGPTLTYGDLEAQSNRLAHLFRAAGVRGATTWPSCWRTGPRRSSWPGRPSGRACTTRPARPAWASTS